MVKWRVFTPLVVMAVTQFQQIILSPLVSGLLWVELFMLQGPILSTEWLTIV